MTIFFLKKKTIETQKRLCVHKKKPLQICIFIHSQKKLLLQRSPVSFLLSFLKDEKKNTLFLFFHFKHILYILARKKNLFIHLIHFIKGKKVNNTYTYIYIHTFYILLYVITD